MRKVLVTAGASGIGQEIAAAFLSAGDGVYTCDINRAALEATARELPGLKTGVCDVGDRKQIETMMADVASQLGGIDILVNNAGISGNAPGFVNPIYAQGGITPLLKSMLMSLGTGRRM